MEGFEIVKDDRYYPIGTTRISGGVHFSLVSRGDRCSLVLFQEGKDQWDRKLEFRKEDKIGDVWNMTVSGDFSHIEYCFETDGRLEEDPFGICFRGREEWGKKENLNRLLRASFIQETYDWEGDANPRIPFEDCVLYRLHPRGFTMHPSSGVEEEKRGTFAGIAEKIPYMKELGATTIELLPAAEFQEVMEKPAPAGKPEASGKVNYWGFVPARFCAPKASYSSGKEKHPDREFKDLVKAMHRAGLELVMDFFFSGKEPEPLVLEVLRFWVREYHVDGFHLIGFAPLNLISRDPYLSRTKLLAVSWEGAEKGEGRHLAEYHDGFAIDMKRFLKGDENQVSNLAFRTRYNPGDRAVINYMANVNGFTLMDNVCYDQKHNEANGENNRDGNDYNFSWNCGVEGPTRKKRVLEMRKKLLRNAYLLTFLSQGTPLLLAGDEFGNTQKGNNNPYCQDNEISWLDWGLAEKNKDLVEFVKAVIRFRKSHPMFHLPSEPKIMDYLSCGQPDVSYHGEKAWCPEFENFRRQLGILYFGKYAKLPDGSFDDTFFVVYNMHWEPHEFSLPNLSKGLYWHIRMNTNEKEHNGIFPEGEELFIEKQKHYMVPARTIVVFVGKAAAPALLEKQKKTEKEKKTENAPKKKKAGMQKKSLHSPAAGL